MSTTSERTTAQVAGAYATFAEFMRGEFTDDDLRDIDELGVDNGFPNLTYTRDCVALHDAFEEELWQLLSDEAEAFGEPSILALLASFRRADMAFSSDGLKNLIVWFAAESEARALLDRAAFDEAVTE